MVSLRILAGEAIFFGSELWAVQRRACQTLFFHFDEPLAARCRGLSAITSKREGRWSVDVESIWAAVLRRAAFPEAPVGSENDFRLKPQVFP